MVFLSAKNSIDQWCQVDCFIACYDMHCMLANSIIILPTRTLYTHPHTPTPTHTHTIHTPTHTPHTHRQMYVLLAVVVVCYAMLKWTSPGKVQRSVIHQVIVGMHMLCLDSLQLCQHVSWYSVSISKNSLMHVHQYVVILYIRGECLLTSG